jgi:RNA polymerase subunit RPABC4/transcription elongation factor Spt4
VDQQWEHSKHCPECGGLNDLDAEWCMQCSSRLVAQKVRVDMDAGTPGLSEIVGGGLDVIAGNPHPGIDDGIEQVFSVQGDKVTWSCGRCHHVNDIKSNVCESCGTSFVESARGVSDALMPKKTYRANLKALGYLSVSAVVLRLVAGFVSPWAAAALFGGIVLRAIVRFFRD